MFRVACSVDSCEALSHHFQELCLIFTTQRSSLLLLIIMFGLQRGSMSGQLVSVRLRDPDVPSHSITHELTGGAGPCCTAGRRRLPSLRAVQTHRPQLHPPQKPAEELSALMFPRPPPVTPPYMNKKGCRSEGDGAERPQCGK